MNPRTPMAMAAAFILSACAAETPADPAAHDVLSAAPVSAQRSARGAENGLVRKEIPADDPGPPFYARVTPMLDQFFHVDNWMAIPFYRDLTCVPADFNLLGLFDPPGPAGPGAFGCPLTVTGFLLTEEAAPLGTFPRQVVTQGDAVPFLFVPWDTFQAEAADGVVTLPDLQSMGGMMGTADRFHEVLRPRAGEHFVQIRAGGTLEDGRRFDFGVVKDEEVTRSIRLVFR